MPTPPQARQKFQQWQGGDSALHWEDSILSQRALTLFAQLRTYTRPLKGAVQVALLRHCIPALLVPGSLRSASLHVQNRALLHFLTVLQSDDQLEQHGLAG